MTSQELRGHGEREILRDTFGIAFAQWIREGETRSLSDIASDTLDELVTLTGAATGPPNRS